MSAAVQPDDESARLVAELVALDLVLHRYRSDYAARWGITAGDALVLVALRVAGGPLRPGELARHLGLSSGTLTPVLRRIEAAGLVRREPHPTDRRGSYVLLTERAVDGLDEVSDVLRGHVEASVAVRSSAAVAEAVRALTTALSSADTRPGRRL